MNLHDLQESLRQLNYFSFEQVRYAIVETNGKMTVIPTAENTPVTAGDIESNKPEPELPVLIISDGKIMKDNLEKVNIDENILQNLLRKLAIKNQKNIIVMNLDKSGKLYYQIKGSSFKVIQNINQLTTK